MPRKKNINFCGICQGPRPMINFREAMKRKTCTDRFDEENNRYTENSMEQENRTRLRHVKEHNLGYPILCDELARKKSLTQITTIKSYELSEDFDPNCNECLKLAAYMKLRHLKPQRRCWLRRRASNKRVSGKRQQRRRRPSFEKNVKKCSKRAALSINRSIQCIRFSKFDKGTTYDQHWSTAATSEKKQNNENENCITTANDNNIECGIKMNTPHPSMSSYNSYASFNHEPMEQQ